jgi:hypothetical protein
MDAFVMAVVGKPATTAHLLQSVATGVICPDLT